MAVLPAGEYGTASAAGAAKVAATTPLRSRPAYRSSRGYRQHVVIWSRTPLIRETMPLSLLRGRMLKITVSSASSILPPRPRREAEDVVRQWSSTIPIALLYVDDVLYAVGDRHFINGGSPLGARLGAADGRVACRGARGAGGDKRLRLWWWWRGVGGGETRVILPGWWKGLPPQHREYTGKERRAPRIASSPFGSFLLHQLHFACLARL